MILANINVFQNIWITVDGSPRSDERAPNSVRTIYICSEGPIITSDTPIERIGKNFYPSQLSNLDFYYTRNPKLLYAFYTRYS